MSTPITCPFHPDLGFPAPVEIHFGGGCPAERGTALAVSHQGRVLVAVVVGALVFPVPPTNLRLIVDDPAGVGAYLALRLVARRVAASGGRGSWDLAELALPSPPEAGDAASLRRLALAVGTILEVKS